jgi:hypothetical protein
MPAVARRRVVSPLLAFVAIAKTPALVTIARGSIIETSEDDLHQPGLHPIQIEDRELFAFARDITERSERLASSESVGRLVEPTPELTEPRTEPDPGTRSATAVGRVVPGICQQKCQQG